MDFDGLQPPEPPPTPRDRTPWIRGAEVAVLVVLLFGVRACLRREKPDPSPDGAVQTVSATPTAPVQVKMAPPPPLGPEFGPPTPQRLWREVDNPKVYMPTGSGRIISANFGSVRTNSRGLASFHEGVDIAPVTWKRGVAQDAVFSVADGTVAYINRVGGNSSYGIYVVVRHQDRIGDVFSLYSHLASVETGLSPGDSVDRGEVLGVMGHTSNLGIPRQRSHLHFELTLMLNPEFRRWYRKQELKPDHNRYHGFNLVGLNPHLLLATLHEREVAPFSFAQALEKTPPAWTLAVRTSHRPLYFDLYPDLWEGEDFSGGVLVLSVSESGIVLSGRNPTPSEAEEVGSAKTRVLTVDTDVLGRNGRRHVRKRGEGWVLGSSGEQWLDILLYRP